jgi:hypothetical protein
LIVSVSRRTDIPAFFTEWFLNRIKEGFVMVRNPWKSNQVRKIGLNPQLVDCLVFWSKNPRKLLDRLEVLDNLGYRYYFLFTLNAYGIDLEQDVPPESQVIETFIRLSQRIGSHRVVWRYDPVVVTDRLDFDYHCRHFDHLASQLQGYTRRCIVSFLDLYKKCQRNLKDFNIKILENHEMKEITGILKGIAGDHQMEIQTCAESIDLSDIGVHHGKCIDDRLIAQILGQEIEVGKDKHQRNLCGCVESVDIGAYNTCGHHCLYCYANYSRDAVNSNLKRHHPQSPLLLGELSQHDVIIEIEQESIIKKQRSLSFQS